MSFHRVVVAFDGSHESEAALALGLRLRDPADGVLTLACVVTGQRWHVGPHVRRADAPVPEEIALMFADARATMIPPGVHVRQRAPVAPSPARGLTELAEREDADLIVVGSSRHGEASRVRLERTAGRLLQGAPCAVAIAPGALRETEDFRHVGIAFDGSPEARAALDAGYGSRPAAARPSRCCGRFRSSETARTRGASARRGGARRSRRSRARGGEPAHAAASWRAGRRDPPRKLTASSTCS